MGPAVSFNDAADLFASAAAGFGLTGAITVLAWVYPAVAGTAMGVAGKGESNKGYALAKTSGNLPTFAIGNGTSVRTVTGVTALAASTWYHLAGTYDGTTTARVYVNGVQDGAATGASHVPSAAANDFRIGAPHNPTGGAVLAWNGRVTHVAVLDAELSPAQIRRVYERGLWALGSQVEWQGVLPRMDPTKGSTNTIEFRADHASGAPSALACLTWRSHYG
jgi:hypothetical protein